MKNFLILVILFFLGCKNPVEEKCESICRFMQACALEANKVVIPDSKILDKMQIQCLGSCTMFQEEFLSCQVQSEGSCEKYFNCIIGAGVFN
jgi:Cys-rich protein (TIGR04453 family)